MPEPCLPPLLLHLKTSQTLITQSHNMLTHILNSAHTRASLKNGMNSGNAHLIKGTHIVEVLHTTT